MIRCFDQAETQFLTNGDAVIMASKAYVHKADNGDFYVELECSLDYLDFIIPQNIIVINTPQGDQAFRIKNVVATRSKIKATCKHIFYDSENYLILDSYVVEKDCNDALDHLNNATDNTSPFITLSDVQTVASFRCVRKSLAEAISVVLERWGGHLIRDNWNIKIMESMGADNGITIQYKKNLKEISVDYNWDDVVTKLLPVGKDGLLLDDLYVSSDVSYEIPFTKTVSFEQQLEREDYETDEQYHQALLDDLRQQAQTYVNEHCIPSVNYTLKANVEKITDVGDAIEVIDERLGISITTNVISYVYDAILEKYVEIEFGNFQKTLSNLLSSVEKTVSTAIVENSQVMESEFNQAIKASQDLIMGVMGNSYVIYNGNEILIVDRLPKETANNLIRMNSAGIAFSQDGGLHFTTAWEINGTFNAQAVNLINLTADMIKGGTLKLGSNLNSMGVLEVYDEANNPVAILDKNGLKMFGADGSYILLNNSVGFAGYDKNNQPLFWVSRDEFHMVKAVIENEITLCNKLRFIPITTASNDGIGLVSVVE